ncbi:MAG: hypothetical protein IT563_07165 [Alphaproteobacteria bacterium]|nr:hypothetical protein [Alphaproteobacteria bacterium]
MNRFPAEFADLLTPRGRRVLDGRDRRARGAIAPGRPAFIALDGMVDPGKARAAGALLERAMAPTLAAMTRAIPPESITRQTRNHEERLIKTVRVRTAPLERRGSRAWAAAERIGLIEMTDSDTWRQFAQAVAGRALDPDCGRQVLRYGPGDYSGPHTDHYPEDPAARGGYVDLHLSLGSPGLARQFLVYARKGHFSEMVDVNTLGGITVYRLPFWHYTTPLQPLRPGRGARRWVVLGTFLYG